MLATWFHRGTAFHLGLPGHDPGAAGRGLAWGRDRRDAADDLLEPQPEGFLGLQAVKVPGGTTRLATGSAPTDIRLSNASIAENSAFGTVIGTFSAVDADRRDSFTFTLLDNAGGRFGISGTSLVVRGPLDFEAAASHQIRVQVRDSGGNTYTEWMTIRLRDVAEPANAAPTDIALSTATVQENAPDGTVVGRLTATDPNAGDTFRYTLLDDAGGRFAVAGDSLVVRSGALLDFETARNHQVTLRVTDNAGASYVETFTIALQNLDGLADQPLHVRALIPAEGGEAYYKWADADPATPAVTITFALLDALPDYYAAAGMPFTDYTTGETPATPLGVAQRVVIRQLLDAIESFANVEFVEVASASAANITFGQYLQDEAVGAYAIQPLPWDPVGSVGGDVWLNTRYDTEPSTSTTGNADWARTAIAHELGHALGLKHPGLYGSGDAGPFLPAGTDNARYTTMSYNKFPDHPAEALDYMLYDIAALQYLYGANTAHAAGDDVYVVDSSAGTIDTIWDSGGFDWISAATATSGVVIDLNAGAFSSIGINGNIGIAFGTTIECAVGGAGADRLVGNAADNVFAGGAGADTISLSGNWGDDRVLDFQDGLDRIQLVGTGLGFAGLAFVQGVGFAEVQVASGASLRLDNISIAQLGQADFLFA